MTHIVLSCMVFAYTYDSSSFEFFLHLYFVWVLFTWLIRAMCNKGCWECVKNEDIKNRKLYSSRTKHKKQKLIRNDINIVKSAHVVTSFKQSPFSCPAIEKFIWNEPLLRDHLSYKATFCLSQRWPGPLLQAWLCFNSYFYYYNYEAWMTASLLVLHICHLQKWIY